MHAFGDTATASGGAVVGGGGEGRGDKGVSVPTGDGGGTPLALTITRWWTSLCGFLS